MKDIKPNRKEASTDCVLMGVQVPRTPETLPSAVGTVGGPGSENPTDTTDTTSGTLSPPVVDPVQYQSSYWFEPQHEKRLDDRAIDLALAYREGTRSCDEQQIQSLLGNPSLHGSGLVYAYNFVQPCYYRVYLDDRVRNKSKVTASGGRGVFPYFMSDASPGCAQWQIHESPEKAMAAYCAGFKGVVGLGGVAAGLLTKGEAGKPPSLHPLAAKYIKPGDTVYLVMDAGCAWNPNVARAEARHARFLMDYGCSVRRVEMPPTPDGETLEQKDQGADDFIARHGREAYAELVALAVPACPMDRVRDAIRADIDIEDLKDSLPFQASIRFFPEGRLRELADAMGCTFDEVAVIAEDFERASRQDEMLDRGDEVELAELIRASIGSRNNLVFDQGDVYGYEDDHWQRLDRHALRAVGASFAGRLVGSSDKPRKLRVSNGMLEGSVEILQSLLHRDRFFDEAMPGASFENGFVSVEDGAVSITSNHRKHRARHRYNCRYIEGAEPPMWLGLLDAWFAGDDDCEAKKAALQEYVGVCLLGSGARTKRIIIFSGDTNSGKSTCLEILRSLFPQGAVCTVPPDSFGSEYQRAELRSKFVNLVAEMPERELVDAAPLKAIVGNDIISGRPIYRDPITFVPTAGHVFATNTLPAIRDTSEASHKRLIILEFNNRFAQGVADKGSTQAEPTIAQRIIDQERDAIISWCIDGAVRTVSRSFVITEPPSSRRAVSDLRTETDPVRRFIEEECELDPSHRVPSKNLYGAYAEWATQGGFGRMNKSNFGRAVAAYLRGVFPDQKPTSSNAAKDRTYCGIRLQNQTLSFDTPVVDAAVDAAMNQMLS